MTSDTPADIQQDILEAERVIDAALTDLVQKHGGAVSVTLRQWDFIGSGSVVSADVSLTLTRVVPRAIRPPRLPAPRRAGQGGDKS